MTERLLELLRAHGSNVYSFEMLEPGLEYWHNSAGTAAVAYVDSGGYWVAVGAPLGPSDQVEQVALEWAREARRQGRGAAFFGAGDQLVDRLASGSWDWLQIGQQPAWDPLNWSRKLRSSPDLRRRLRRAVKAGVSVSEVPWQELQAGSALRAQADALVLAWETAHAMPPMRFMVTLDLFSHLAERRFFVARDPSGLVGLLVGVPIYARGGWLLDDLLVLRGSAPGASEALIDLAMSSFERELVGYVSLGMVALSGLGEGRVSRYPHPILDRLFNFSLRSMSWLYSFHGIRAFRSKFMPDAWEPVYLVGYRRVHLFTMRAVLMAFSGGWLPRFAARVATRQLAPRVARVNPALFPALAAGMTLWSGVLLSHAHLFGGLAPAWGWTLYDWLQAGALWKMGTTRDLAKRRKAAALATRMAAVDALVSLVQLALSPRRSRGFVEGLISGAAVTGPLALAGFLWLYERGLEDVQTSFSPPR
ncbi:DUF2156 domain-containing protein [bacterium CPR1]|nr:DUF2156 domain-containing protein [bacterium CPR1]